MDHVLGLATNIANKTKTPMVKLSHKSSPCSVSFPNVVPNPNLNVSVYVMFAIFAVDYFCSHNEDFLLNKSDLGPPVLV